ncbi:MAG: hypothetical protein JXL97_08180 [Bacteroidales bacterium]|nr:hypothetical protein [Bacteroidales bacterium]
MKKIIIISVCVIFASTLKAQFNYSLATSLNFYRLTTTNPVYLAPEINVNLQLGYYLSNTWGISSGAFISNRYFDIENERITSKNIQIPLLVSKYIKIENTPFGLTSSIGYLLSVPFDSKSSLSNTYDIGLIHGGYFSIFMDNWVNENVAFFGGVNGSYDFMNKNNIKFWSYGITLGFKSFL